MVGHCSLVVNDPSGELLSCSSGMLLDAGYDVKVLNYSSPYSQGYNPLAHARTISDIGRINKTLVTKMLGQNSKDPFFNLASEAVLNICTRYLLEHTPTEYHSLYNVHHLISTMSYAPEKMDRLMVKANNPDLLSEYKALIASGERTLQSILATARTATSLFGTDPIVALNTAHDTIDLSSFRKKKTCLFVNTTIGNIAYYSICTNLFLEQFFGDVMSYVPQPGDLPLFFLIEEASSLYFSGLNVVCSNIRKSKSGILQVYQSPAQLNSLYGSETARAIRENSFATVYMSGQTIETARELSQTLGHFQYTDERGQHTRLLLTPNEVRELEESLIFCGNKRAIKSKITPYFQQAKLRRLSEIPPYVPVKTAPFTVPPLLNIP